jgi:hypothetical protein
MAEISWFRKWVFRSGCCRVNAQVMLILYNIDQYSLVSQRETNMAEGGPTYRSYLLRLWREDSTSASWRASLESVTQEGEPHHFPDLGSLVAFLLDELGTDLAPPGAGGPADDDR